MFLTLGNLGQNPRIGLLFIDFENPHRLRCGDSSVPRLRWM
jgi:hypothetical protein